MKRVIRLVSALIVGSVVLFSSTVARATLPVIDYTAVAQLIQQVRQTLEMIDQLKSLSHYADLDHISLASGKFSRFLGEYRNLFDQVMNEINSYQNGGLLGQIERLDEIYQAYYNEWGTEDDFTSEMDPLRDNLKKQLMWTRIQFKHAAKVAAKIRETIPDTDAQVQGLLEDTHQAVGIMQSIKIGNELTGTVAKTLQNLNIQLTEVIQAQAAEGLQRNQTEGQQKNRSREALKNFGERSSNPSPAPLNPIGAY